MERQFLIFHRLRRGARIGLIALMLILLRGGISPALAAVRESDGAIVDRQTQQTLDLLPRRNIGVPSPLPQGDAYLIVTQGAAYVDVRLIADHSVAPQRLADALESAVQDTPLAKNDVDYSRDDDYSAAHAQYATARFDQSFQSTDLSTTGLVKGIRAGGIPVFGVLKVPRYASAWGLPLKRGHSQQFYWYNTRDLSSPSVRVQARATRFEAVETLLFLFFVPVVTFLGILLALLVGRSGRIPIETRRRVYLKLVWYPSIGSIILHFLFLMYYLQSPVGRLVADLWFGCLQVSTAFMPFIAIGPLTLLLIVPFATRMERRLYGRDGGGAPKVEYTPAEKTAQKTVSRWMLLPMALVFLPLILRTFVGHHQTALLFGLQFGAVALVVLLAFAMPRVLRAQYALLDQQTTDDELTQRAEGIAQSCALSSARCKLARGRRPGNTRTPTH
ncbi:MAG TPA: hypothetical protein VFW40_07260 [Capsulimonadaceae bacterium]|nr:hypothetical protein [Capsulimonadaceae bacterium]